MKWIFTGGMSHCCPTVQEHGQALAELIQCLSAGFIAVCERGLSVSVQLMNLNVCFATNSFFSCSDNFFFKSLELINVFKL